MGICRTARGMRYIPLKLYSDEDNFIGGSQATCKEEPINSASAL